MALMVAFLCSGLAAVPVVLLLDHTDDQGDALSTPIEAVSTYLLQLDAGDEIGLRRALAEDQRDELLDQWRTVLKDMQRSERPPNKLEWPGYDTEDQGAGRVRIAVQLSATWWGDVTFSGTPHPWVFDVHQEDGGWRITKVTPFPWCGGHIYAHKCK